jgi:hypothetical protein
MERGVRLDECLLDGIVGVAVGREEMRGPDRDGLVPADQLLIGHDVASPCAIDQLGVATPVVFQWTALHGQP